jgi:hypothetical protein
MLENPVAEKVLDMGERRGTYPFRPPLSSHVRGLPPIPGLWR